MRFRSWWIGWIGSLGLAASLPGASAPLEFNRDIRPILSDRCFACHGPDAGNRKSKLRLDQESAAKSDLGKGRVGLAPGDPAKSEVYKRITATNAMRMPPAYGGHDRLPDREIELIRQWIEQGANYQPHWSFLPPRRPELPPVKDTSWSKNAVDRFILARLEREGLHPSPQSDRIRLLRRVTLDLTGLPPTPEAAKAFADDSSPQAYEKVVDRLLASPRYAERMAIRWMEAARYADTNGYQSDGPRDMWRWRDWVIDAFQRNMPFDQFTVEQLAGDLLPKATLPQKIATGFHRNHRTSAEGGIVDEEFRVEYVADRTETTAQVWLGLTVGCARCHDHKYDPIPQRDYYRMFAFFNNVPERGFVYNFGNEEPYVKAPLPEQQKELDRWDALLAGKQENLSSMAPALAKAQAKWERKISKGKTLDWAVRDGLDLHLKLEGEAGSTVKGCATGPCTLTAVDGQDGKAMRFDGKQFVDAGPDLAKFNHRDPLTLTAWVKPESLNGAILSRNEDHMEGTGYAVYLMEGKVRFHEIFRWSDLGMRVETAKPLRLNDWQHIAVTYDGSMRASGVRIYVDGQQQELKILFDSNLWPIENKDPFRVGAGGGLRFNGSIDEVRAYRRVLPADELATLMARQSIDEIARISPASRTKPQSDKLRLCFEDTYAPAAYLRAQAEYKDLQKQRQAYYDRIPTVMVMQEAPQPRDAFVLKRGAYDAHGEKVTAGVLSALPPMSDDLPRNRLGLAKWLVDRRNPLTARVAVNRFWAMLFGTGMVKTLEDFGSQGEWPMNQELLDWLAVEFVESGWDVKHIVKTMVMSAAYQQSSKVTPDLLQRDPENRLLARGPRLRLSPEMIRDQALAASGLLVEKVGGPSVKPYQPAGLWKELQGGKDYQPDTGEGLHRRSLYTYWRRTVAPPNMVTFDSPNRETCVVRENRTNTPLQALNLMNDVTYVEAARALAARMVQEGGRSDEERIAHGFSLVLARTPQPKEQQLMVRALQRFRTSYAQDAPAAQELLGTKTDPHKASELAAYTAVASLLLNLDETVTKE